MPEINTKFTFPRKGLNSLLGYGFPLCQWGPSLCPWWHSACHPRQAVPTEHRPVTKLFFHPLVLRKAEHLVSISQKRVSATSPHLPGCVGSVLKYERLKSQPSCHSRQAKSTSFLQEGREVAESELLSLFSSSFPLCVIIDPICHCISRVQPLPVWWRHHGSSPATRSYIL